MQKGDELEERVRRFANAVIEMALDIPRGRGAAHFADQMLRAASNARAHYGEARSSESARDFIHKLSLVLKELRETYTWLDGANSAGFIGGPTADDLIREADELIAIFCASRATAKRNLEGET